MGLPVTSADFERDRWYSLDFEPFQCIAVAPACVYLRRTEANGGDVEIRYYGSMRKAETTVPGEDAFIGGAALIRP